MKKINPHLFIAVSWMMFTTGVMYNSIGQQSKITTYDWKLPVTGIVIFTALYLLGYNARKYDEKN